MWQKCSAGFADVDCSVGEAVTMTWANAITLCEDLDLGGYSDWRLPDVYELPSIVDYNRHNPAIDPGTFPGTLSSYYWSSSTPVPPASPTAAWEVDFNTGILHYSTKTNTDPFYVRCVRGTPPPSPHTFTVHGDGTVTDDVTGLMWQQMDDNDLRNWDDALDYCEDLVLPPGEHTDWRLPDVKELRSIIDYEEYEPALDPAVFPGTNFAFYWSSNTTVSQPNDAWYVHFSDGQVHHSMKVNIYHVRCVR
jgi:hypothetical protein